MKPRKSKLAFYILSHEEEAGAWILRTQGGAMVKPFHSSVEKPLAIRYSANLMREFVRAGQHCELKIRNRRSGEFMPARTYPGSADPRSSRG